MPETRRRFRNWAAAGWHFLHQEKAYRFTFRNGEPVCLGCAQTDSMAVLGSGTWYLTGGALR